MNPSKLSPAPSVLLASLLRDDFLKEVIVGPIKSFLEALI
jgi:hypothetical protein